MDNTALITWIFGILASLISGLCLFKLQKQSDKDKDQAVVNGDFVARLTVLENTAVSDEHVRKVIREEMQQVNVLLPKLWDSMHKIELYISEQKGYKEAQALMSRRKQDQ
jgi:hypothetical protein